LRPDYNNTGQTQEANLGELTKLVDVARLGSLIAAQALGSCQSTVSQHLGRLEVEARSSLLLPLDAYPSPASEH